MGTHPIFESDFDCLTDVGNMFRSWGELSDIPCPEPSCKLPYYQFNHDPDHVANDLRILVENEIQRVRSQSADPEEPADAPQKSPEIDEQEEDADFPEEDAEICEEAEGGTFSSEHGETDDEADFKAEQAKWLEIVKRKKKEKAEKERKLEKEARKKRKRNPSVDVMADLFGDETAEKRAKKMGDEKI